MYHQKYHVAQQQQVSLEPITNKQFLKKRRLTCSTITSPLPTHHSHWLKMCIKLPTPRDKLSPEHATSPLKKKSKTTLGSLVNDLEEDEERTYLDEIGGKGGK